MPFSWSMPIPKAMLHDTGKARFCVVAICGQVTARPRPRDLDRADQCPSKGPGMTCSKERLVHGKCQVPFPAVDCHTRWLLSDPSTNDEMRRWLAQQRIGAPAHLHRRRRPQGSLDYAKLAISPPFA